MSIQDITNYVRQTPGNTNPSVIKSMVKSEIGEYVEEASNEALRKLGVDEKTPVLTYDGNTEGKKTIDLNDGKGVRVGDVIDVNSIQTIVGILGGEKTTITRANFSVYNAGNGQSAAVWNDLPMVIVMQGRGTDTDGTYVIHADDQNYVQRVELTTEITPISDKYLPEGFGGGGLPFVKLETIPLLDEGDIALSESDAATIEDIFTSGAKCFAVSVYLQALELYTSTIVTAIEGNGMNGFIGTLPVLLEPGVAVVMLTNQGGWKISLLAHL